MNGTKQRHVCVSVMLWAAIISNVFMAIYYAKTMFSAHSTEITIGLGIQATLSIINVLGVILLLRWNKNGFYLFLISSLIACIVNISILSIRPIVTIGSIIAILIWWAILYIKKNKKTVWSQLELGWDLNHCRHLYQVFSIICIICFAFMLIAASFNNNKLSDDSSFEEDTIDIVEKIDVHDSMSIPKEDLIAEGVEPNIVPAEYYSKDLQTYKLHGNVKHVYYYYISQSGEESYRGERSFNKRGKQLFDYKDTKVIRNKDGRILEIEYDLGGQRFSYDSKGETISFTDWDTSTSTEEYVQIDKIGNPLVSNVYGEGGKRDPIIANYYYSYIKWDNNGNWTKRKVRYVERGYEDEQSNYYEKRIIVYFK